MQPAPPPDTGPQFTGTSRFEVVDRLGKGGMGVVYRVRDRERGSVVALKTLRRIDAASLFRFKKEFRALTDIVHDNLVALHELVYEDERWFFTMELVDGVDVIRWVRGRENQEPSPETASATAALTASGETLVTRPVMSVGLPTERALPPIDYDRLRAALRQLAGGVAALHSAGYLHRDIKPSNVLVTPSGRVVLLDFGVITEVAGVRWQAGGKVDAVGTPAFMAPEQVTERGAGEASDWYALGGLLYLALTGRRPFEGRAEEVLRAKQSSIPAPPRLLRPGVPTDLDRLCVDLLAIDPDDRPSRHDILRRLGVTPPRATSESEMGGDGEELIGRTRQLQALTEAFETAQSGQGLIALVHGLSGMGKSTLVERFLDDIVARTSAVVLAGRCYERESVPYKAVDSLIDALCHYLLGIPATEAEALMPRDAQALATVFPVLRRVQSIAQAPRRARTAPDPREVRRRAFAALRELLGRLADRRPLILCVDDLQWGDGDSAVLIEGLMRRPDAPALLFLGAYRSDEVEQSPLLRALREGAEKPGAPRIDEIEVAMLGDDDAAELAERLLGARAEPAIVATVARESGGNPFFVRELARFHRDREGQGGTVTLEQAILARLRELPAAAQRFVEVASVAGKPTEQQVIQRAADLDEETRVSVLSSLRAANLIRTSGVRDADLVEPYHDRVRETVLASLFPERQRLHHWSLAVAIQAQEHPDAETLAAHFAAAGERASAADYALRAASQAESALSFARAAELYQLALEQGDPTGNSRRELLTRRAVALVNAGRGPDAAAAFVEAAALTSGFEATELRRQAAEHWLRSGHVDHGMEALNAVLDDVGLALPRTSAGAIRSLLVARARLRLRGLRFRPRETAELRGKDLARIDVCWSIATGLSLVEPVKLTVFGSRGVMLSLAAGDPYRIARALALEAGFQAALGARTRRRVDRLLERVTAAAELSQHPHARALAIGMRAFVDYENGRFVRAHEGCEQALELLRDTCVGTYWESGAMQLFSMHSLVASGEVRAARRLVGERLADAEARGDLNTSTSIRLIVTPTLHLAAGDSARAKAEVDAALRRWCEAVSNEFCQQHYMALSMKVQHRIYLDDPRGALELMAEGQRPLRQSLLLHVHLIRASWLLQEAQASLLAAADGGADSRQLVARAQRIAGKLEREGADWCTASAALLRGGAAVRLGDADRAVTQTRAAIEALDRCSLKAYAAAARRRLAALVGGGEGDELRAAATAYFAGEEVGDPEAITRMFAPGY